MDMIDASDDLP